MLWAWNVISVCLNVCSYMFILGNVEEGGQLNNNWSRSSFKHQLSDLDVLRKWSHSRPDFHSHRLCYLCMLTEGKLPPRFLTGMSHFGSSGSLGKEITVNYTLFSSES